MSAFLQILTNPHWIFALTVAVLVTFVLLIRRHGTVLMGFTIITALQLFIQNQSLFFITYVFRLDDSALTSSHYFVYSYIPFALLAFAGGVWLAWRPLRKGAPYVNPFLAEPALIFVFVTIGAVIILAVGLLPRIPTVTGIFFRLGQFLQIGLLGAAIYGIATQRIGPIVVATIVFIPVGLFNMLASGHAWLLGAFLLHPVLLVLFWRKPAWWRFPVFAVWLYMFYVAGGIWLEARPMIRGGELRGSFVERSEQFLNETGPRLTDIYSFSPEAVHVAARTRLDLSVFLAAQSAWMPENEPYSMGQSLFVDPLLAVVPRILWPEKTLVLGGNDFINQFTGFQFEQDRISVDTNIVFELYANFAVPGVIIGLFAFGFLLARLELNMFRPGQKLTHVMMISATLFVCSMGGRRAAFMAMEVGASVAAAWGLGMALVAFGLVRERIGSAMRLGPGPMFPLPHQPAQAPAALPLAPHGRAPDEPAVPSDGPTR